MKILNVACALSLSLGLLSFSSLAVAQNENSIENKQIRCTSVTSQKVEELVAVLTTEGELTKVDIYEYQLGKVIYDFHSEGAMSSMESGKNTDFKVDLAYKFVASTKDLKKFSSMESNTLRNLKVNQREFPGKLVLEDNEEKDEVTEVVCRVAR